jgi:hypothetical protein
MLKNSPEPLNLTTVDARAKELIKNGRAGQKDSTGRKDPGTDD